MIRISEALNDVIKDFFPHLELDLKKAQMNVLPVTFLRNNIIVSLIFAFNFSIFPTIIILQNNMTLFFLPLVFMIFFGLSFYVFFQIPRINIAKIRQQIETDIFVPSRMLLTLLESGSSLVTALVDVSYTNAYSSKYFGKIASEIYLGKNIEEAIDKVVEITPSASFRRVMEPIKKSLRIGTNIHKNLQDTLEELSREKVIEIEKYEKKLTPATMFYMMFGTIVPSLSVVAVVIFMSLLGIEVVFFPFLFILLFIIFIIQILFISLFKKVRPLVQI